MSKTSFVSAYLVSEGFNDRIQMLEELVRIGAHDGADIIVHMMRYGIDERMEELCECFIAEKRLYDDYCMYEAFSLGANEYFEYEYNGRMYEDLDAGYHEYDNDILGGA